MDIYEEIAAIIQRKEIMETKRIVRLPGRSCGPDIRGNPPPWLIFPRVDKSSNGDGACEGSRVRNRSTRKVCSRTVWWSCSTFFRRSSFQSKWLILFASLASLLSCLRPVSPLSLPPLSLSPFLHLSCHPGLDGRFIPTPCDTIHTHTYMHIHTRTPYTYTPFDTRRIQHTKDSPRGRLLQLLPPRIRA